MGQAKHNPTAIAAKNGEVPPKPKPLGAAATRRLIEQAFYEKYIERLLGGK